MVYYHGDHQRIFIQFGVRATTFEYKIFLFEFVFFLFGLQWGLTTRYLGSHCVFEMQNKEKLLAGLYPDIPVSRILRRNLIGSRFKLSIVQKITNSCSLPLMLDWDPKICSTQLNSNDHKIACTTINNSAMNQSSTRTIFSRRVCVVTSVGIKSRVSTSCFHSTI